MHVYGKITHVHLPYKSVTGRRTYVIYLMSFNIHACLGFIQFIKFSVWPAEMGKIKADVNALPPTECTPTSCKAWNQLLCGPALVRSLPSTQERPVLTRYNGSAAGLSQRTKLSNKKSLIPDWEPGRHPKGHSPYSARCWPDLVFPSSKVLPPPSSQEFPGFVCFRNPTAF